MHAILCSRGKGGGCKVVDIPVVERRDLFGRTELQRRWTAGVLPLTEGVMRKDNFPTARVHKRRPSLSLEQFDQIIAEVSEASRAAFHCIVVTGMRLGEYIACRPEHLNASARTLFIPGRKTEESEGVAQIDARLWHLVVEAIPPRYSFRYYEDVWAAAVKKTKLPRVTIHDLRHVHGQWAINAGVPESMVQASFRHKSPGMTRDYIMQRDSGRVSAALADLLTTPKRRRA